MAAVEEKIAGQEIVAPANVDEPTGGGQVVDLMAALRASLSSAKPTAPALEKAAVVPGKVSELGERKPAKRAPKTELAEKATSSGTKR